MQAKSLPSREHHAQFDTDSGQIGVDNRCSGCISHKIEDFTGPLMDTERYIRGFAGTKTTNVKVGTIIWRWDDDKGIRHKFVIPKSYYVPEGGVRLLSPQHWAQTQKDSKPIAGTGSKTTQKESGVILEPERESVDNYTR